MDECFGKYFILNGTISPIEKFDNSLIYEGESVYEVLRLINGVPVFFSDHADRLEASTGFQGLRPLSDKESLRRDILRLTGLELIGQVNLKIVFNYNNGITNCLVYYIEPFYPTAMQYENGVKGLLFHAERKDPGSKVFNHRLRSEIYQKLIEENCYEALLVDRHNRITEGSRSNLFFISGDGLATSPDNAVLSGITRKHLVGICRENGIVVEYKCVRTDEMSLYESVVMTGTSPLVLPFNSISNVKFNVKHPLIAFLRYEYIKKAEESQKQFTSD